jgi:biopolymer transport protein ExbB/TolQ
MNQTLRGLKVDDPVTHYIYQGAVAIGALLIGTWAWLVRAVFFKQIADMEKRIADLEQNTLSKSDIFRMERELKAQSDRIVEKLSSSQKIVFEKIERTEDKIDGAHDRILNQIKTMVTVIRHDGGN